jgi:hypothetical protein
MALRVTPSLEGFDRRGGGVADVDGLGVQPTSSQPPAVTSLSHNPVYFI